jgi:hypothetical protein
MSDEALKPCPLCGEPFAKLADHPDHFHPFTECFLEGTRVTPEQVPDWNRRASDAEIERLRAALRWFIDDIDGTHTVMLEFDAAVARARAALENT